MSNARKALKDFLDNFNYIHTEGEKKGKRTGLYVRKLMNEQLTGQLEQQASALRETVMSLHESGSTDQNDLLERFFGAVTHRLNTAWQARDQEAGWTRETDMIHSFSMFGPDQPIPIRTYEQHAPYAKAKFEREVRKALTAARESLDGADVNKCDALLKRIKQYNPVPEIRNVVNLRGS